MIRLPIVIALIVGLLVLVPARLAEAQTTGPTVSAVSIESGPGADGGYAIGDEIEVGLTFSGAVTVTGAPQLNINVGGQNRTAAYSAGSGNTKLVFTYAVAVGDEDRDGIAVVADSLARNGGTIRSGATSATLTHAALQASDHKVDGIAPTVTQGGETRAYVPPSRLFNVVFYFSEPVYGLTDAEITVTNGTAHDVRATRATAMWPRYTRWDAVVMPSAEGPVTVTLQAGAATDAYGNGIAAPVAPLSVIAADPVTIDVAPTTSGFAEGGNAEFTVTRSRDNGAIPVSLLLTQMGDFLVGAVQVYPPPDPDDPDAAVTPREVVFTETPFTLDVTLAAGEASKRIVVLTEDDYRDEEDGAVLLSVPAKTGQYKYIPGPSASATADVRDNDVAPAIQVVWNRPAHPVTLDRLDTAREGGAADFTLLRSLDNGDITVSLTVNDASGYLDIESEDGFGYEVGEAGSLQVRFAAGSRHAFVFIPILDDDVARAEASVTLTVGTDGGGYYVPDPVRGSVTVPIADNDSPLAVNVDAPAEVVEGGQVAYTLNRVWDVRGNLQELTVNLQLEHAGDYIIWPADHQPDANDVVTIPVTFSAGRLTTTLTLDTEDDGVSESSGSVTATILADTDGRYTPGANNSRTTTLLDDDPPVVSVAAVEDRITEGTSARYRVTRVGSVSSPLRVGLYVTGLQKIMTDETEATVLTSESDDPSVQLNLYGRRVDYIMEFAAGETEKELSLTTEADGVNEGDGWLAVSILQRTGAPYVIGAGRAQVHVVDDDLPTVNLNRPMGPSELTLSDDGTTWEGEIDEGTAFAYSVSCAGVDQFSDAPGKHLTPLAARVFYANHPAFYGEVSQEILGYNVSNILPVGRNCNGATSTNFTFRFYVGPENGLMEVELVSSDDLISIPGRAGQYQTALFAEHRMQYVEAAEEAEAAGTLITRKNIFAPGTTARFSPEITCYESSLRYCPQYRVGTVKKIRLTVINRDPTILIKAETASITEGQPARFVLERQWAQDLLELDAPFSETVVYLRAFQDGRYITGDLPTTITFGRNETRKVIALETMEDAAFGPGGSVTIELLPDTSTGIVNLHGKYTTWQNWLGHTPAGGRSDRATVTIADNDDKPGIAIAPSAVTEGDPGQTGMVFTLTLTQAVSEAVTVSYSTADGTASAGVDYTAVTAGSATIPAGATNATFSVPVLDDRAKEDDETFTVTVSLPETPPEGRHRAAITGGNTATAVAVIQDDDPAVVTVVPKKESVMEGQDAVFVLTRAGFIGGELSVQVRLRAPGRVENLRASFAAGAATTELSVVTPDNDLVDYPPTRAYSIEVLGDGGGNNGADTVYTPGEPGMATVNVTDDDRLQVVTVHANQTFVPEGTEVVFTFRRTGDISGALPITYYRSHRTANQTRGRTDFIRIPLLFPPGKSEITTGQIIACIDDDETDDEPGLFCDDDIVNSDYPRQFNVHILGDGGRFGLHRVWKAGSPDTASIVYYDNDRNREVDLQAGYPDSSDVGQTVRIDFQVLNTGSEATGDTITVSSVQRAPNDSRMTEPPPAEPRVGCTISGPLAAGETGTCTASFILTEQDLLDSPMALDATATDGTATSAAFRIYIRVLNGAAVGFTKESRLPVIEPAYGATNTKAVLAVMRVGEPEEEVQVAYTVVPLRTQNRPYAAEAGADYVDNSATPGILTFAARETEKDITIDILGDQIQEQREQFQVTLFPPVGVRTLAGKGDRVVVILDGTPPPGESYTPTAGLELLSPDPTSESAGSVDFAVVLDRVWGQEARFEVELDAHNNLTATPAIPRLGQTGDFEDPDGLIRVTIPAGQTRFEFSLALHDDDLREEDETFQLLLGSSINRHFRLIGENDTVLVTIADDDLVEPGGVELALTNDNAVFESVDEGSVQLDITAFESVSEGSAQRDITVTASFSDTRWPTDALNAPLRPADPRAVETVVRVQFDAVNSTAGVNDLERFQAADSLGTFHQVESFDIVIPAGQTSGMATLRFKPADDDEDEDDEAVVLLGAEVVETDSDAQLSVTSPSFTIVDDDMRGITIAPPGLNLLGQIFMDENATYSYTMVLDSAPTGPVTIGVAPRDADSFISMRPATLTFTASNWDTPQVIEVTALEDGTKDEDFVYVYITHEVSGGDYEDVTVGDIYVTITDTTQAYVYLDDAQALESDGHIEFTVSVRPTLYASSVDVRYATVDGTAVAGTDYTREVDAGKLYKVLTISGIGGSATIRIPITDDQVYESSDKTFSLQLTLHNERALLAGDVALLTATGTIRDDDPRPVVSVAGPAGGVSYIPENAKSPITFTLTLTGQVAEDVSVSYTTGEADLGRVRSRSTPGQLLVPATAGMDYTATTGSVVFSPGETTKQVTVQVTDDDVSEDTEFFGLRISNAQNAQLRNGANEETADVGLLDDDARGVVIDPISINLREPATGQTAESSSYTVRLSSRPTGTVTVTLGGTNSAISLSGDTLSSTNTLTFTASNWNTAQTVTVTPVKDANGTSETVTLTHVPQGADYTGIAADSVTANVTDSDGRHIVLSAVSLTLTEGEESGARYTVKLSTRPTGTVNVGIGGHAGTDMAISGSTLENGQLTFTTSNWDMGQAVVVRASHDADADDEEEILTHTASGGDYPNITKDLPATIEDDAPDTVTVMFGQAAYSVAEGDTQQITVTLSADPERTVEIPITGTGQNGATTADYSVPTGVTFNSGDTSQTITFEATSDSADDDDESVTVGFGSSLPAGVTPGTPNETEVSITDDDTAGIVLDPSSLTVTEEDAAGASYTVKLATQPSADVTVSISGHGGTSLSLSDGTLNGDALTFTTSNWDTAQTVTVKAAHDDNAMDESFTLAHTGSGGGYANVTSALSVTVTDDAPDTVAAQFGQAAYSVAEGSTVTVTVTLSADPERTVTIPLTATNEGGASSADYSSIPANVIFTSGETQTTFTFTATSDSVDDDDESVTVGFGSSLPAGVTPGTPNETAVSITDDDVPSVAVMFGQAAYTVAEGSTVTVTVTLSADPERTVTIPVTATGQNGATTADYSVPASVTFNSGDTSQTITFTATSDSVDDDDESVTVGFGSSLPAGVTPGTPNETAVSITDDDAPSVAVMFGQADYTVAEGSTVTITVSLSADLERTVTIPLTATNEGGASNSDYSGVPATITFTSGETQTTFTFTATSDSVDDDDESVTVGFGSSLPAGVTSGTPIETEVSITDDDVPSVEVMFGQADYTVAEGSTVTVAVSLSADPERTVTIPLTATNEGGASNSDYSGIPANVTFTSGDTSQTFTFEATSDSVDDDDESVTVGFGSSLPAGVTAGTPIETEVSITDDDAPSVAVSFGQAAYSVAEGSTVTITVSLSADLERTVTIPLTATNEGGASNSDYSGVPATITFTSGETQTTFTFTATSDSVDDDDESVTVGFGSSLPAGVTPGTPIETEVSITDDDVPSVEVMFGQADYTVAEGSTVTVVVSLSADPERTVTIPLTATNEGGASNSDYSGIPANVTFTSGDTSQTFTFEATSDSVDDDDESVTVGFGSSLPAGVTPGTPSETEVSITDDDVPSVAVMFGQADYTVAEGSTVTVAVSLSADPERTVTIPLTATNESGASSADYSGIPANVTFTSGDTSETFTFTATSDSVDDDDESVTVGFGSSLPAGVTSGTPIETEVSITDDDVPSVEVMFGQADYTVAEGSTVTVAVSLSADPERTVTIPLTATNEGGASNSDYSGIPANVTFNAGDTSQTFTFTATSDSVDDDDESVTVGFGSSLPAGVTAGTPIETEVSITDDDAPSVAVSFGQAAYSVAEGSTVTITVSLSADLERTVTIPLTATNEGGASNSDYSGVPATITFTSGETQTTFTFTATSDSVDDDDESVTVGFGSSLPAGVTPGTPIETEVSITDDDVPSVEVMFGQADYTVAEGSTVTVVVSLSADPERTVTIPLTATNEGGASNSDYSGIPANVTFTSGDTSQTFTFEATSDSVDDDDESVTVGFGSSLPAGVTPGTPSETEVSITDDDVPSVEVMFGQADYTVAEGSTVTVAVSLSADPERTVTIPLTATNESGASSADYSGIPANVTFTSGDTSETFTFTATSDSVDDDDESVTVGFGSSLPAGVTSGTPIETEVSITDDDVPSVEVMFGQADYTVAEGSTVTVVVSLSADPERTVTIPLTATNEGGASNSDYSGIPANVTFTSGDTSQTFTFEATSDSVDDDDESVTVGFGSSLPAGVTAGTPIETEVSITDDDAPSVAVSFGQAAYSVAEGSTVTITVSLSADLERTVTIPLTATNEGGASNSDYSGVPATITFTSGETQTTFTFTATSDSVDDDDESVTVGFGSSLPAGVTPGTPIETEVSITDDDVPSVEVMFGQADYTVAEGSTVTVVVSLSADPERTVTIPLTATNEGGASNSDYSGIPANVTFTSGDTSQTFTFEATSDSVDDDDESVTVGFGSSLPAGVTPGTPSETEVSITDDDVPSVAVMFGQADYTVAEGSTVTVAVSLSADPERTVTIPLTATNESGASSADYSGIPANVTFTSGDTSETFTFTATSDSVDDDDESVTVGFGSSLPAGVTSGTPIETEVSITDDDAPSVAVSFGQADYTVAEGSTVTVAVTLSADPERTVTIPLTATNVSGASNSDYSGVPATITFTSGETSETFTFTATSDSVDDDDESVTVGFGSSLPAGVTSGTPIETEVSITDDDAPSVAVMFGQAAYSVAEGSTVTITVTLSADPERTVTIPLTATNESGASSADYSGIPANVTFTSGDTSETFTFTATQDSVDDDGESVTVGFGSSLPAGITPGTPNETEVSITDDDVPSVAVMFGQADYSVAEGSTVPVTVTLSADPERTVEIPLTATNEGGASISDFSGVPATITFNSGDTSQTITFEATSDDVDDDDESVTVGFGSSLPAGVTPGTPNETEVSITDDDVPSVAVMFGQADYSVAEGSTVPVTVTLSADPERTVTIPLTATNEGGASISDFSGVPATITFTSGDTSETFTFEATSDDVDDDDESVTVGFGSSLPAGVTSGTPIETEVSITDDDVPQVTVSFENSEYTVAEGATTTISVTLSGDPERTVEIPITATGQNGATAADYSVPTSVTFNSGDTSQTITFTATSDSVDDDDESVTVGFGSSLPAGVTPGTPNETEVSIIDGDVPSVTADDNIGDLRLVDGVMTDDNGRLCEGRLEIYYDGEWGTICDDFWSVGDANVACRQLGFAGGTVLDWNFFRNSLFPMGDEDQPIWLDDLRCEGGESNLLDCRSNHPEVGMHNCSHREDVLLRCLKNTGPWIVDMEFSDPPGGDGSYDAGETVEVTLVWSEEVTVSSTPNRYPLVMVFYGEKTRRAYFQAYYATGSGTSRTVFTHTLQAFGGTSSFAYVGVSQDTLFLNAPGVTPQTGSIVSVATGAPAILGHRRYRSDESGGGAGGQAEATTIRGVPTFNDPGTDGVFGTGETIEVIFTFAGAVQVDTSGGTPAVTFKASGTTALEALYLRGSGTAQLAFGYTLTAADGEHRSLLVEPNSLALNGGVIRDEAQNEVALDHQGGGSFFLPETDNDAQAPEIQSATVDGATLTLDYNELLDVAVTPPSSAFTVNVNGESRPVTGVVVDQANVILLLNPAAAAGDTATVDYTVPTGESDGKVQDTSGNAAESFSGQEVTNNTASSEKASVEGNPPGVPTGLQVNLQQSGRLKATWEEPDSGPAPNGYTVQWKTAVGDWEEPDDVSETDVTKTSYVIGGLADGVEYAVRVVATSNDVDGDPTEEVTATPRETTPPVLSSAGVDGAELTLTFDDALDESSVPDTSAFAVTAAGVSRGVESVTVSGSAVTLMLVTAVTAGDAVTVDYTAPADESESLLQDEAGNEAATFSGQSVTNYTAAAVQLTASANDVPESHDGSTTFAFELRFSETPEDDFSYRTLRDHAFSVTGGQVVKANRLVHGENMRWQVHVTPDGSDAVTVTLPPTTDCEAEGAICTEDGRMLSNRLEVTIPQQNTAATGAPTITGTVRVGETLSADTAGIADADGIANDTFSYQWIANDGAADADISGATGSSYTLVDADEGKAIMVRVSFTDNAGYDETLTSAATAAVAAAAPVVIPEEEEEQEEEKTTPLTAGAHDVPGSHGGIATFTFELRFSEQIPLSYATLRDLAFTVTGGEVTKVRRLELGRSAGRNVRWEISVTPDGNGVVTIVLPPTTDCEAGGALCTRDGRMLSNRLEISVTGPSG